MDENLFILIVLFGAGLVLFVLYKILPFCYNICRISRSKDEDEVSLEEVVVDQPQPQPQRGRVLLGDLAVMKHIRPGCQTDEEAEIFSRRRNILSEAEANTVIKAQEWDFHLDVTGEFIRSNSLVPYWHCEKLQSGEFKVLIQFTSGF